MSFPVHLTGLLLSLAALLLPAVRVSGQQDPAGEEAPKERPTWSVVVPLVVNVRGIGDVEWRTELLLRNDTSSDMDVALTLTGVPGEPFFFTTMASGESIALSDPVVETFGLVRAMSPMTVTTAGARSVSISSSIVGYAGGQRLRPQPLSPLYTSAYAALRSLSGLEISESFRTNIGLVNFGEAPASFSLALQRIAGRNVATAALSVAGNSVLQLPLQTLFPLMGNDKGLTVIVDASSPQTFCYASVLDNTTQQPRLVSPGFVLARPFD